MTLTSMTETERKYDVDEHIQVPDLGALGEVQVSDTVTLRAVYYDTPDGALAAHLVTLRRRSGGKDEGWHVKFPSSGGRTEHHAPLGGDAPPSDILDLVRAIIRRQELAEVARLTTQRTIVTVLHNGSPLLEVADDLVSATDTRTGILRLWREWEAELLPGAPDDPQEREAVLDAAEQALVAAGAVPSASASKLARATGRTTLASSSSAAPVSDTASPGQVTALQVATTVLSSLTDQLVALDPQVRQDAPDAVHTMRITVRRLRAALALFRGVLNPAVTEPVREQLSRLGDVLGAARDTEVRRSRAVSLLDDVEAPHDVRPDEVMRRRLIDDVLAEYGAHLTEVYGYLSSDEYFVLLDALEELAARPPVTAAALEPAKRMLRSALRHEAKRSRTRLASADRADLPSLHEARKATRRLRYAAEALSAGDTGVFGKKTSDLGAAAEAVQDVLGEHRDATLFVDHLTETSREAAEAGEYTAGYGALAQTEHVNSQQALLRLDGSLKTLARSDAKMSHR